VVGFGAGRARHINNIMLGRARRNRSNVWHYAGNSSFHQGRDAELAWHPTVKPVALCADAMLDCSNRRDLILDPFGGSGTTLIAADRCGRRSRLIEISSAYVDVTLHRARTLLGLEPVNLWTGATLTEASDLDRQLSTARKENLS
jgi:DNA modification methylase